jgi:hypothetical protein
MAFNLRKQSIQFSKPCGWFRIPHGRKSPKLSNMECNTPLSELFRNCISVRSVVRWQAPSDDIMFRSNAEGSSNTDTLEIRKLFLLLFSGL